MFEFEIWIDVFEKGDGVSEPVCTLFAAHELPMRPLSGESLSYYGAKDARYQFHVCTTVGPVRSHSVRAEIDEVSHYAVNTEHGVVYKSVIRCVPIEVPLLEDAKALCAFMTEQADFELDPYGINRLGGEA